MTRTRRLAVLAAVVTLLGVGLSGGPASGAAPGAKLKPDPRGTLRLAASITPTTWNPLRGRSDAVDFQFMSPLYDQLFQFDENLEAVPSLAESFTVASDLRSITLKLRKGVTFHDGSPFNAQAVVTNMEYGRATKSSLSAETYATITSVTAVNDSTVRIDTTNDAGSLPLTLAFKISVGGMVSPKALANDAALATTPAGSGPYELVSQTQDRAVYRKVAKADYWDAKLWKRLPQNVELVGIADENARLSALQSGQLDGSAILAPVPGKESIVDGKRILEWQAEASNRMITAQYNYVRNPLLAKPEVRRAISMAIDREAIAKTVTLGACRASAQPFVEGGAGYNRQAKAPKFDPVAAKKLLADNGAANLELKVMVVNTGIFTSIATAAQSQLAQAGVKLTIEPVNSSLSQTSWRSGNYDMNIGSTNASSDPAFIMGLYFTKNDISQPFSEDPALKSLATKAAALPFGSKERDKAYQEIAKYIADTPFNIIFCIWPPQAFYRSNVLGVPQQGWAQITSIWDVRKLSIAKS